MGKRKIIVRQSAAKAIAQIAFYIESKGLPITAERYADSFYDFIETLSNDKKSFRLCSDSKRASLGFKCIQFKNKYTIVFLETEKTITVCEIISSKLIWW